MLVNHSDAVVQTRSTVARIRLWAGARTFQSAATVERQHGRPGRHGNTLSFAPRCGLESPRPGKYPLTEEILDRIYSRPERDQRSLDRWIRGQAAGARD